MIQFQVCLAHVAPHVAPHAAPHVASHVAPHADWALVSSWTTASGSSYWRLTPTKITVVDILHVYTVSTELTVVILAGSIYVRPSVRSSIRPSFQKYTIMYCEQTDWPRSANFCTRTLVNKARSPAELTLTYCKGQHGRWNGVRQNILSFSFRLTLCSGSVLLHSTQYSAMDARVTCSQSCSMHALFCLRRASS